MNIFIINLQKETERRRHIESLCTQNFIKFNMVKAVDGFFLSTDTLCKITDKEKTIKNIGRELTRREIACALSHKAIYEKMKNDNIEHAVIFEDDIVFDKSIIDIFNSIKFMPKDWECIMLCYYKDYFYRKRYAVSFCGSLKINKKNKVIRFIEQMHSAAAYMINLSGANKLLAIINKGICQPIDHYIGNEKYINLYGIHPRPIYIDYAFGSNSSISPERNKKITPSKGVKIRDLFKKYNLFKIAKMINTCWQKIYFSIEHYLYVLMHINACLKQPANYSRQLVLLIISPEFWSDHFVSKHHYALSLSRLGYKIFFIEPPKKNISKDINIKKVYDNFNLYIISSKKIIRGLRFYPSPVRVFLEKRWLKKIENKTGEKIDIIWLFENSRFFDMRFAGDRIKIYHQVDLNQDFNLKIAASTADICFCTTNFIKNNILKFNKKTYKIDHGVTPSEERRVMPFEYSKKIKSDCVNAVYVGNIQMEYLDSELLAHLVCKFTNVQFHFIGGYTKECSLWKLAGDLQNIIWWGKVDYHFIQDILEKSDVLLILYKEKKFKDQANPHKIMEYLSSGKVVVATYTDEYKDKRHLIEMVDNSADYINLFERVVNNLPEYNSEERQISRRKFAESNSYDKQIDKIFSLLKKHNLLPDKINEKE